MTVYLIKNFTQHELECELLMQEHEVTRCRNNADAFQFKSNFTGVSADHRADFQAQANWWRQKQRFADHRARELGRAILTYHLHQE